MKQNINKVLVNNNPELLSEMESLLILGGLNGPYKGENGDSNSYLSNCDNNTYCSSANCVPQCGCSKSGDLE